MQIHYKLYLQTKHATYSLRVVFRLVPVTFQWSYHPQIHDTLVPQLQHVPYSPRVVSQ